MKNPRTSSTEAPPGNVVEPFDDEVGDVGLNGLQGLWWQLGSL